MFEITILQETLMVVLNYLDPTVGKNTNNLGDDCISMEATDNGSCVFYTTNTNESTIIEAVCSNATKAAQSPYVNFKRLKGIISTIASTEYITIKEGVNELFISFAMRKTPIRLSANVNGMITKPSIISNIPIDMVDIPISFFSNAITKANSIIQDSDTVQIMNCIKLTVGNPDVTAEAIDVNSKRTFMISEKFGTSAVPKAFLIEASKMSKSLKLFEDFSDIEIGSDNATILIKGNNRPALYNRKHRNASNDIISIMYCIRQLSGIFPNVSQYYGPTYFPSEFITVNKSDIINSISRIKAIGDDTSFHTGIQIKVDRNEFNVKFNSQYGDLEDPVDVYNSISGSFGMIFNHKQLEEILKSIDSDYVDIGMMNGTTTSFIIKGASTGSSTYNGTDVFSMLSMAGQQTP